MNAQKTMKTYHIRIGNQDVKVRSRSHADARRKARQGKGRVVGVYF